MRIYISVDMEGTSCIVSWREVGEGTSQFEYTRARMSMVGDLNAAIDGAFEAGADEIVVADAHSMRRTLPPDKVNKAAYLIRGSPSPWGMMDGIDKSYDAALYIGYHSMNGTKNGILCHTISTRVVDALFINGLETGEFGLNAALAGWYGVPSIFMSGDSAGTSEARRFVPNICVATVKWGLSSYSAKCLPPEKSQEIIKRKVIEAIANIKKIEPYKVNEPVVIKLRFLYPIQADVVSILPSFKRYDGKTVEAKFRNFPEAFRGIRASITLASTRTREKI
jgi:D-amino peptidase